MNDTGKDASCVSDKPDSVLNRTVDLGGASPTTIFQCVGWGNGARQQGTLVDNGREEPNECPALHPVVVRRGDIVTIII